MYRSLKDDTFGLFNSIMQIRSSGVAWRIGATATAATFLLCDYNIRLLVSSSFRNIRGMLSLCRRAETSSQHQRCSNQLLRLVRVCQREGRRSLASASDRNGHLQPGERLHGFTLKRMKGVPELELTAWQLHHDKTKTEYLHVARDDANNVFSIGFKTNPPDATGVPHILEHTTLCGSEKYPIRDPFFKMLPRSLSNFMNAFTSSDHTTYPFATTNRKDFGNLMSVYLDATLRPLLKEDDFIQEGWRIGPRNPMLAQAGAVPSHEDSALVFKGVVYNEMKGQMSDASYLFYTKFQDHIFPEINNSGGDPQKMTDLTYGGLKDFHSNHYHPSNAKIFTYGNMPLAEHLRDIDQHLVQFEPKPADGSIKSPIDIQNGPLNYVVQGPADPLMEKEMQYKTSTSWVTCKTSNILETFSLGVMSSLLLDGYGSSMYSALIESGLGSDFSPNTGFDSGASKGIFSVGLVGVKQVDIPKVKKAIVGKLQEVYKVGFDKGKIDGILHQIELALKHKTANFGLGLMQRIESGWFNGVDPFDALSWNEVVHAFQDKVAKGGYLEELLRKYLLNDNSLTFTMEPSEIYGDLIKDEENLRLASKISQAADEAGGESKAQEQFAKRELKLLEAQTNANTQDLSCLPSVHINDIPREMERKTVRDSSLGPVKIQWREASTNGLTYFRAINALPGLSNELRMLLPLFTNSVMRLGTKDRTVEELEDRMKLKTGGISISYHSTPSPYDARTSAEGICLSGHALDSNVSDMLDLFRTLLHETNFDGPEAENQIRQLLQQDASGALDAIASSGHSYAGRFAQAGLSAQGLLNEQIGGLTQVQLTANLASRTANEGFQDVIAKLKILQQSALSNSDALRIAITCGRDAVSANEAALDTFLSQLLAAAPLIHSAASTDLAGYERSTFLPLPYQVYYSALALPTVSYVHSAGAALQILSQLLTHKYLHHEIREKGGAYGGGAYARGLSGIFNLYSYRDPNPQNTMTIMKNAGCWARDRDWTERDLEEAKLSTFQSVDAPQSVNEEGMTRFLSGITEDMEQIKREQMLDVKREDLKEVAQRFLVDGMRNSRIAILGEECDWIRQDAGWSIKKIELQKPSENDDAIPLTSGS